ncbi:MAG TPA: hypothetical protein VFP66_14810 [Candidatus Limnocylindrales bacterium]|nr:hypothetical protein [Candidatus Limnocylindrales bacterium]
MDAALVAATWALVVATVGLVIFAAVQAMAGWDARDEAKRQADLLAESLDVSRRLLAAAENERAAAAPLELRVDRVDSVAGSAILNIRNDSSNAAMRLARVQVIEMPSGDVVKDESLAEGTIGVNEGWKLALEWDASQVGTTYVV